MKLWLCCCVMAAVAVAHADELPTDNPVATFYCDDAGYPGWTDRIAWSNVIDMKVFAKGKTEFERFENARDQLAAQGGGVDDVDATTYVTVSRGGKTVVQLTGRDVDMDRSQGEVGLFVPDAGYPFGAVPDWLIRQRSQVPDWAPDWARQHRMYDEP